MLTCKDASHLISERQDRSLGFGERWRLRIHLWLCLNCRRFEQQLAVMRQALRNLGERAAIEAENRDLSPEARTRIRKALHGHDDHAH